MKEQDSNNDTLVSVLMTSYNREKYIAEAIESVLASTFNNFELLIVDDASNDDTVNIASDYLQKDQRIKLFVNEKNIGQFANRNKAASLASGKYLKYLDSDDKIEIEGLEIMVNSMEQYPQAALGLCYTIEKTDKIFPFLITSVDAFRKHFFGGGLLFTGPSGLIIRKDKFEEVNSFEEYGMPSDNHLSLKLAGRFPVIALPPNLFHWRRHEEQVFHQNKKNYDNILLNYNYTRDIIAKYSPLPLRENRRIIFNQSKLFYFHLIKLIFRKGLVKTAFKLFNNR